MKFGQPKDQTGKPLLAEVVDATQSVSGLMSAKDKVKLDNADTTYLQVAGGVMRGEIQRSGIDI